MMSDNLNGKQFEKVYGTDENPPKYVQKLKSPWIPNISSSMEGRYHSSKLSDHIMRHHTKSYYEVNSPSRDLNGDPLWMKGNSLPAGKTEDEHHEDLHKAGYFEWGQEHKHFEPKKRK